MQRPTSLSRRAVLLGGVVALPLSGCGIRLEDDAPDLPLVPHRTPVAGEAALLAMVASLRAERPAESVPAGAAAARAEALTEALTELGIPTTELERASSAGAATSQAEDVAAYESALRECQPGLLQLVGSLAVARVLRGPAPLWTGADRTPWQRPDPARSAASDTRAAAWTLTVAAARAEGEEQTRLRSLVAGLEELLRLQTAAGDDDGSGAPLGYDLDDPLATAAERAALARTTLTTLTDRLVALLPSLDADRTAAHEIVAWAATTLALGQPWQLEIGTLPGYGP